MKTDHCPALSYDRKQYWPYSWQRRPRSGIARSGNDRRITVFRLLLSGQFGVGGENVSVILARFGRNLGFDTPASDPIKMAERQTRNSTPDSTSDYRTFTPQHHASGANKATRILPRGSYRSLDRSSVSIAAGNVLRPSSENYRRLILSCMQKLYPTSLKMGRYSLL